MQELTTTVTSSEITVEIGGVAVCMRATDASFLTRFASASGASATRNNLRVSAGIVFRFGTK